MRRSTVLGLPFSKTSVMKASGIGRSYDVLLKKSLVNDALNFKLIKSTKLNNFKGWLTHRLHPGRHRSFPVLTNRSATATL